MNNSRALEAIGGDDSVCHRESAGRAHSSESSPNELSDHSELEHYANSRDEEFNEKDSPVEGRLLWSRVVRNCGKHQVSRAALPLWFCLSDSEIVPD